MAEISELIERLTHKFKDVPNVDADDLEAWIIEAAYQHGYDSPEDVPLKESAQLLLLAQAEGAKAVALSTAHYFQWTDQGQSINKLSVSAQYRQIARDCVNEYHRMTSKRRKASSSYPNRADNS